MGRVLLKVCPPHIQAAMRKADVATSYIGYHIGRQWVRLVHSASKGYIVSVTLTKPPVGVSQGREDVAHEPVCQQAVQQPVQGHYRC